MGYRYFENAKSLIEQIHKITGARYTKMREMKDFYINRCIDLDDEMPNTEHAAFMNLEGNNDIIADILAEKKYPLHFIRCGAIMLDLELRRHAARIMIEQCAYWK